MPPITAEERFAAMTEVLLRQAEVTRPPEEARVRKRFGSTSLKVKGKIFAMLVRGKLVVKLPVRRVDDLVDTAQGQRFEPRPGRPMKEWVTIEATFQERWLSLAREALAYVAAQG